MDKKEYLLGNTKACYLINERGNVSLLLYPKEKETDIANAWEKEEDPFDPRADYMHGWMMGALAYFSIDGEPLERPGFTMKSQPLAWTMTLQEQYIETKGKETCIVTILSSEKGYEIKHCLTHYAGRRGLECETTFYNKTGTDVELDMLTSVVLDNLSPFQEKDAPNTYFLHRFYGGWSLEGKRVCTSIEDLALEKTWGGFDCNTERFGSIGSYPVERYFPTAVFEDRLHQMFWGIQIAHNATWEIELSRYYDTLTFSGGLGDYDFCGWKKKLKNGESFTAPKAYISAICGDIYEACGALTDMQKNAWEQYGEEGLPISFNEYCTTWGKPTQEKMLRYCDALQEYGVKYVVVDAGWVNEGSEQDSNGEWDIDTNIFPNVKEMNRKIREKGMVPGIWFEMECTTEGSRVFLPEYDDMHLKRNGKVIKVNNFRSYWDFRREDVRAYLKEKVIDFLKENDFGYIKVDYNANTGIGVDGADSPSEGLREHLAAVREFFVEMKREIPDLIIENCASGGHRLEPTMMGVSAMSSFSDAHESVEIPYIAANAHNLMLPVQSLIWAVFHEEETRQRTIYSLAATFLGRMCLSGQVDRLTKEQSEILKEAIRFYGKLEHILKDGQTRIYGNRGKNTRYPTGTQVVVRATEEETLVVCHAFDEPGDEIVIDVPKNCYIADSFYNEDIHVRDGKLVVPQMKARTAQSILLKKGGGL